MTKKLNATDAFFLQVERPASPMHIGTLSRFKLPKGKDKSYILEIIEQARQTPINQPPFNYKLARTALGKWNPAWEIEEDIDIDYHLRHSALPQPGGERELAVLISRLHSIPLDRSRPMWEFHIIEGFADDSFALYGKMHHALIDGVAGSRLIQRTLASKPAPDIFVPMWGLPPEKKAPRSAGQVQAMDGFMKQFGTQLTGLGRVSSALTKQFRGARNKDLSGLVAPYTAPDCVLNGPIGPQRRVSTQSFPLTRIKALAKASKATLNDIIMTICGGALRGYLQELHALPDDNLVAQVPVSVRAGDEDGGNAISLILANLGTAVAEPGERLKTVKASMDDGKALLGRMSKAEIASYSAMLMAPFAIGQMAGIGNRSRNPMFNVVISNVPGPKEKLYLNQAEMTSCYPVSLVFEGQALNITIFSYANTLNVVYTACRSSLPHVQHLVGHAEAAYKELKKLYKVR